MFPELWGKGRRWSGYLSSLRSQLVGEERMLYCPWGSCLRLHSQVLWRPCLVKSMSTSSSEPSLPHRTYWHFCICLIFDIPTHYRFLGFFADWAGFLLMGEETRKGCLHWPHGLWQVTVLWKSAVLQKLVDAVRSIHCPFLLHLWLFFL